MALTTSVDTPTDVELASVVGVPDSPAAIFGSFATAAVVGQGAAALDGLGRHASAEDWLRWRGLTTDGERGFGSREGLAWRVEVSPGVLAFRRKDYGRAARREEAATFWDDAVAAPGQARTSRSIEQSDHFAALDEEMRVATEVCAELEPGRAQQPKRGRIAAWSAKSRAKMVERLGTLDYEPMLSQGAPAMVTLTYPGDWLAVAPSAAVCAQHVRLLQLRYRRAWGAKMVGVWKREFQRRGAPHYHLFMVPPVGRAACAVRHDHGDGVGCVDGPEFREWLASTWVDIVGARGCGQDEPLWGIDGIICCERHRHHRVTAHPSTVDVAEGSRYTDPRRVGVYFSKHGSFAAKDYQNDAPAEWLEDESAGIGRFWGVWGLRKVVAAVEVEPDAYDALRRTARRWQAGTALRDRDGAPSTMVVPVWRKRRTVDRETGEIGFRWVKRSVKTRIRPRLGGRGGFMMVNDAPGLAIDLGRMLDPKPVPERPAAARRRAYLALRTSSIVSCGEEDTAPDAGA